MAGVSVRAGVRIEYLDREEVINAGEVYYLPPGHTPVAEEDSEMVEFSPKSEYRKTMEVAIRNMKALNKAG
jgi:ribosomal protein L16 Arg81 hydroxylase